MTREDMAKLWRLAENLFPPPRNIDVEAKKYAWYLTFREHSYSDVRDAITTLPHKGQRFFPDAHEIAALLPEKHEDHRDRISAGEYETAVRQYCRLVGADQPPYGSTTQQLRAWFERVRDE